MRFGYCLLFVIKINEKPIFISCERRILTSNLFRKRKSQQIDLQIDSLMENNRNNNKNKRINGTAANAKLMSSTKSRDMHCEFIPNKLLRPINSCQTA